MHKISVIVPVYNTEQYLETCLNSIINQTYKDIEIIVVNDGTKDNSQDIINRFSNKYPQLIKSYIKENGGLSDTRNYGIEKSTGQYITFIDSDDYISHDMLEKLYESIITNSADVSACECFFQYSDDNKVRVGLNVKNSDGEDKRKINKRSLSISMW